jgi:hypothetical protein
VHRMQEEEGLWRQLETESLTKNLHDRSILSRKELDGVQSVILLNWASHTNMHVKIPEVDELSVY